MVDKLKGRPPGDKKQMFLAKIKENERGCWIWQAGHNSQGYGRFRYEPDVSAHRASYRLFKGDIPEGIFVCHTCDVRNCVNPDHLWLGTCKDNLADAARKQRMASGSRNTNAKFTKAQVIEILTSGLPTKYFTELYGVSKFAINHIKRRKCWKHVVIPRQMVMSMRTIENE